MPQVVHPVPLGVKRDLEAGAGVAFQSGRVVAGTARALVVRTGHRTAWAAAVLS